MQHTADPDLEARHQLRQTAFHEAGHAVAAFALGRHSDVMELSVIPDGVGWGHVLIRNIDDGNPSRWRGRFVGHEIMILLADNVAQDIYDYSANRREIAPPLLRLETRGGPGHVIVGRRGSGRRLRRVSVEADPVAVAPRRPLVRGPGRGTGAGGVQADERGAGVGGLRRHRPF